MANGPGFHWEPETETEPEPDHDPSSNPRTSMRFLLGLLIGLSHRMRQRQRKREKEGKRVRKEGFAVKERHVTVSGLQPGCHWHLPGPGLIEVMSIALKHDIRFNLFGFYNLKGDNFLLYGPRHVGHP